MALKNFQQISQETTMRLGRRGFYNTSFSEQFCDFLSYYIYPVFVSLKMSPNFITSCALVLGVITAFFISVGTQQSWILGLVFYAVTVMFDHIDGRVALHTRTATYFGYFFDAMVDSVILTLVRLALVAAIYKQFGISPLLMMACVVCFLTPFYVFIHDKYSVMARRINQERNLNIKPYIRNDHFRVPSNLIVDLERIAFIISIINFSVGIWIYYILNFFQEVTLISYHMYCAFKHMRVSNIEMTRS